MGPYPYKDWAELVTGLLAQLQAAFFSQVAQSVCPVLNNWENYRTSSQYMDNLVVKMVIFEFINRNIVFFYIAFVKGSWEGCVIRTPDGGYGKNAPAGYSGP